MVEITTMDAIIELILREVRARAKTDYGSAMTCVVGEIIVRCNSIIDQVDFEEKGRLPNEDKR